MRKPGEVLALIARKLPAAKFAAWDFSKLNFQQLKISSPGRKFRHDLKPLPLEEDVTALQTSFSVRVSLQRLRVREWSVFDLQYLALASLTIGSLWIIEPAAPFLKTAAFLAYMLLLLMPATSQFFLPSWPIWAYLLLFFASRFIPYDVRPAVSVKVLPALEDVLSGADLSNILSEHTSPVLDVLAWIPYGIGHFALPAACAAGLFAFAAPGTAGRFARAFGWMSAAGVAAQLAFPCTPPWYERLHGLERPAAYGTPGSAAGLARVDALLGLDLYTTSFAAAPVPFGAFPSLHAADAALEALFVARCFPRLRAPAALYVAWLAWATMYLGHHYAVDLVGGAALAAAVFSLIVRAGWLPRQQPGKAHRWEYTFVEEGGVRRGAGDEESGPWLPDSDAWSDSSTSGSSTLSAGSASPNDDNQWARETAFLRRG